MKRLVELDLGDAALVFGRIDRDDLESSEIEAFHIGRLAVSERRRCGRLACTGSRAVLPRNGSRPDGSCSTATFRGRGRSVLGLEDELFGEGHIGIGDDGLTDPK